MCITNAQIDQEHDGLRNCVDFVIEIAFHLFYNNKMHYQFKFMYEQTEKKQQKGSEPMR